VKPILQKPDGKKAMTTSKSPVYAWIWLPQQTEPIVCGRLWQEGSHHYFEYGHSYLQRENAIALDPIELPLRAGIHRSDADIHRAIRDAAPDAWGRRVILYQKYSTAFSMEEDSLSEIDFLLHSNSNRIGALHIQTPAENYQSNDAPRADLTQLMQAAEKIETGQPLPADLQAALLHGTSIGGARPKALVDGQQGAQYIAKFSSATDIFAIVKTEFAAMQTAQRAGITTAKTQLHQILGKDVLLVERFDRSQNKNQQVLRHFMISGLTALQLHEMEARYASYLNLADFIRNSCADPETDLIELYRRMVFNILIGNTDDHARNHAFIWNGRHYRLTPAYDICPMLRVGQTATQAMRVGKQGARSTLANALSGCQHFGLTPQQAAHINQELTDAIRTYWPSMCELAQLSPQDRTYLSRATILSNYCFYTQNG
jgi:serine/threonine-protein kinase HipA